MATAAKHLAFLATLLLASSTTTAAVPQPQETPKSHDDAPSLPQLQRGGPISTMYITVTDGGVHTMTTPIPKRPVLTIVTMPRGRGAPVTVTSQRQLVTSYVPIFTICPLAQPSPLYEPPVESRRQNGRNVTVSTTPSGFPSSKEVVIGAPVPSNERNLHRRQDFHNASECWTSYTSTVTPICATTLTPLAAPFVPITACDQDVTFSSRYGYTLVPASEGVAFDSTGVRVRDEPDVTVETLTTYFVAPWTALNPGAYPTGPIEEVVCDDKGICTTEDMNSGQVTETMTQTAGIEVVATGPANIVLERTTMMVAESGPTSLSLSAALPAVETRAGVSIAKASTTGGSDDVRTDGSPLVATAVPDATMSSRASTFDSLLEEITSTRWTSYTRTITVVSISASQSGNATMSR